ncbi:MAG TPA: hypothetical protein VFD30_16140 [Terriglobia bacterium]|jgi:hypothetical protein|nr:hypothetical protein [Terriglobia bacterium]
MTTCRQTEVVALQLLMLLSRKDGKLLDDILEHGVKLIRQVRAVHLQVKPLPALKPGHDSGLGEIHRQ